MSLKDCRIIDLPTYADARGKLSVVEGERHLPFEIKRVYYLYQIAAQAARGEHGHIALQQLMVAIAGSFTVTLDDGTASQRYTLDSPDRGLYICPMIWRTLEDFSHDAVCMVFASERHDEGDYIRDYDAFLRATR